MFRSFCFVHNFEYYNKFEFYHKFEKIRLCQLMTNSPTSVFAGKAGSSSALHLASQKNLSSVVRSLVAHGAVVDAVDSDGWSPLMVACRWLLWLLWLLGFL